MSASPPTMIPKPSILLVDDDEMVLAGLDATLRHDGYHVVTVRSGYAALEALQHGAGFDLVITDLKMPGLSGIEVLECVGELSPATRVVVISGFPQRDLAEEALRKGAREFLLKPVDHARLRTVVQTHLAIG